MDLLEKFENERAKKTFRRIDESHTFDWFVGYNEIGNKCLVLISKGEVVTFDSTKFIKVTITKRIEDEKSMLIFELTDNMYTEIYIKLCEDLIETTRNRKNDNIFNFILNRWNMWKSTFKNSTLKSLSENEIKGLIGELLFLKEYMFNNYSFLESVKSWQGPENSHKDFEIDDTWYEIKTTNDSSLTVKINSAQQLESNMLGRLVIIKLTKSNELVDNAISLNKLIKEIDSKLEDVESNTKFWKKLDMFGYIYDEDYNNYSYKLYSLNQYDTSHEQFPKIVSGDLKKGVSNVTYDIIIEQIEDFKIKE